MRDKYYSVTEELNKLINFIRLTIQEKNLNYRIVARNSRGEISHSTVSDIINGRNLNPSTATLRGLARGLGVTEEEIFALARGKEPDEEAVVNEGLYRDLQKLSPENRKVARRQIAGIIEALASTQPDYNYIEDED